MSTGKDWYQDYLASSHWKQMRKNVYNKYGSRCSVVGCRGKKLHIHHLSYQFVGTPQELNDLRPLCWLHHRLAHYRIFRWEKVPLNRKNLTLRYMEIKRFHWRSFRPSDWLRL